MFGRKQSAYSLENWRAKYLEPPQDGADEFAFAKTIAAPQAAEPAPRDEARSAGPRPSVIAAVAAAQAELDPAAAPGASAAPARPARPDPAAYKAAKDAQEAQGALLKLDEAEALEVPLPDPRKARRGAGQTKTRILGLGGEPAGAGDVISQSAQQAASAPLTYQAVGWLVVIEGPGRGHSMPLRTGVSPIGRGADQPIQLDFGDTSISRQNHAAIAFDEESRAFFIGHGGKANLVRLNGGPVLATERLSHGDKIRIGETTLQLVAFCSETFTWSDAPEGPPAEEIAAAAPEAAPEPAPAAGDD